MMTTAGAKTNAIPQPTRNLRTATSATVVAADVPSTDSDERKIPTTTTLFGPHLAARSPPGSCISPSPR
jgi:hypothetical protein